MVPAAIRRQGPAGNYNQSRSSTIAILFRGHRGKAAPGKALPAKFFRYPGSIALEWRNGVPDDLAQLPEEGLKVGRELDRR